MAVSRPSATHVTFLYNVTLLTRCGGMKKSASEGYRAKSEAAEAAERIKQFWCKSLPWPRKFLERPGFLNRAQGYAPPALPKREPRDRAMDGEGPACCEPAGEQQRATAGRRGNTLTDSLERHKGRAGGGAGASHLRGERRIRPRRTAKAG